MDEVFGTDRVSTPMTPSTRSASMVTNLLLSQSTLSRAGLEEHRAANL